MNNIRFDSVGGASGDMILAALLDLGADADAIRRMMAALGLPAELHVERVQEHGMAGTRVTIRMTAHEHAHRGLAEIHPIIQSAPLSDRARQWAVQVFQTLAEAEARVHQTTPDKIHFHEVGAVDSIMDILGCCMALDLLNPGTVSLGPLPLGCGTVRCAHGELPVPVPAVVEMIRNLPVTRTQEPFELVTPTGAALLTTWMQLLPEPATDAGPVRLVCAGNGFGHRTLQRRPNLLRASCWLAEPAPATLTDTCLVLECNLDDCSPEWIGRLCQVLMEQEALDVFTQPVTMKKQRPGTLLTVLCPPARRENILDTIFRESTTFGVREYTVQRTTLAREHITVQTPFGPVRIKQGAWKGQTVTRAPEYEDCLRCAQQHTVPVRRVYEEALRKLDPLH